MRDIKIINCHTHIFTRANVPTNFLPAIAKPLGDLLQGDRTSKTTQKLLTFFGRKDLALLVKKYHQFLKIGDMKSQLEIFKVLQGFYPEGTKFAVLSMDMEFMGAGKVKQSFREQILELASLKRDPAYKDILLPFVFAHPERLGLLSLMYQCFSEFDFAGIKIYPPLGYYPFDKRLYQVYRMAEDHQIPITAHCARGGVFYKGAISNDMRKHPITGKEVKQHKNKFFTDIYTDPDNYKYLLNDFPKLKINLAHFGGFDEWSKYLQNSIDEDGELSWYLKVYELIKKHPNVYTDVSYTMYNKDLLPLLKLSLEDETINKKILFGTDYYMIEQQLTEKEFSINLRASIGEEKYRLIAEENPLPFLKMIKVK
jgi:predicted TIM-barrel fold metal-dependent hydrolase